MSARALFGTHYPAERDFKIEFRRRLIDFNHISRITRLNLDEQRIQSSLNSVIQSDFQIMKSYIVLYGITQFAYACISKEKIAQLEGELKLQQVLDQLSDDASITDQDFADGQYARTSRIGAKLENDEKSELILKKSVNLDSGFQG